MKQKEFESEWLTVREVAEHFKISTETLNLAIRRGEVPAIRVFDRTTRIPRSWVSEKERGVSR